MATTTNILHFFEHFWNDQKCEQISTPRPLCTTKICQKYKKHIVCLENVICVHMGTHKYENESSCTIFDFMDSKKWKLWTFEKWKLIFGISKPNLGKFEIIKCCKDVHQKRMTIPVNNLQHIGYEFHIYQKTWNGIVVNPTNFSIFK